MTKAPYTFPHKSRAAMIDYLMERSSRSYHYTTFRFAWKVKAYGANFDGNTLRKHEPNLAPALDHAWERKLERDSDMFWQWCEDAGRYYSDGEYSSYPGDDQGDWGLSFAGRSGGWVVLESWRGQKWLSNPDREDLQEMPFADLRAFYRGIVCLDSDLTPANASRNVEAAAAFDRSQWEEEMADDCAASFAPMIEAWAALQSA